MSSTITEGPVVEPLFESQSCLQCPPDNRCTLEAPSAACAEKGQWHLPLPKNGPALELAFARLTVNLRDSSSVRSGLRFDAMDRLLTHLRSRAVVGLIDPSTLSIYSQFLATELLAAGQPWIPPALRETGMSAVSRARAMVAEGKAKALSTMHGMRRLAEGRSEDYVSFGRWEPGNGTRYNLLLIVTRKMGEVGAASPGQAMILFGLVGGLTMVVNPNSLDVATFGIDVNYVAEKLVLNAADADAVVEGFKLMFAQLVVRGDDKARRDAFAALLGAL